MQMDQRDVVGAAMMGLVEPLAPQRQSGPGAAETPGSLDDLPGLEAAGGRDIARRAFGQPCAQRIEAAGVVADEVAIDQVFPQQHMQHRAVQKHIAAGCDLQMQVGELGGLGATGIDHRDEQLRIVAPGILDAPEHDRMRPGRVGAGDQQMVGQRQILITAGHRIRTQRGLVAGHRAGHAQPRVGVDVVGADQRAGELVEDEIIFGEQLARHMEGDRIRAMPGDELGKALGGMVQRGLPAQPLPGLAAPGPQGRMQRPTGRTGAQMQGRTLGAQTARIGRVLGIALHAEDALRIVLDQHATAGAAIAAHRAGLADRVHDALLAPAHRSIHTMPCSTLTA